MKEQTFEKVLDAGRSLYISRGSEGFSLRELAKTLNMAPSNIYNYVSSKRELWYAMLNERYFSGFIDFLKNLKAEMLPFRTAIERIFQFLINLAIEDRGRYNLMFETPPPPLVEGQQPGHFEKEFQPTSLELVKEIITERKPSTLDRDPAYLTLYFWGWISGIIKVGELSSIWSILEPKEFYERSIKEFFDNHQSFF